MINLAVYQSVKGNFDTKDLPATITAAAAKPLGTFALMVIVLAVVALIYFRKDPWQVRLTVFLFLFAGTAAFGYAVMQSTAGPQVKSSQYAGLIQKAGTTSVLPGAIVQLEGKTAGRDESIRATANDSGEFSLEVPAALQIEALHVTKPGYKDFGLRFSSPEAIAFPKIIFLSEGDAAKASVSSACNTLVLKSGPQPSGSEKDWSGPYTMDSGPAPPGCAVDTSSLYLVGDRQCGFWATCEQVQKSASSVVWQFRLQGHEESPSPKYSEGVLTVNFKPQS